MEHVRTLGQPMKCCVNVCGRRRDDTNVNVLKGQTQAHVENVSSLVVLKHSGRFPLSISFVSVWTAERTNLSVLQGSWSAKRTDKQAPSRSSLPPGSLWCTCTCCLSSHTSELQTQPRTCAVWSTCLSWSRAADGKQRGRKRNKCLCNTSKHHTAKRW